MSQKLFHKLEEQQQLIELNLHSAEKLSNQIVQDLIIKCENRFEERHINKLSTICLSQQIIFKNTNNFNQAYIPKPEGQTLYEDTQNLNALYDKNRPYSAKIQRIFVQKSPLLKRNSKLRSQRSSVLKGSFKNSMIIRKQTNFLNKTQQKTFFELQTDKSFNDFQNEQYINLLRKKKISQEIQNNLKQRFIKTSELQNDQYPKINKKFVQSMGNKHFYYNKFGQVGEVICKSTKNLAKKTQKQKPSMLKIQNNKRKNEKTKREIVVQYKGKENLVKKTREQIQLQSNNTLLFYKSNNCTYQIVQQNNHQA